jgi:fatty-acyl-CoA synthase
LLAQLLDTALRRHPQRTAIEFEGAAWSYRDLERRSNKIGALLMRQGLSTGEPVADRVALATGTTPNGVAAYLAIVRAGLVVVPINTYLSHNEVEAIAIAAGCSVILYDRSSAALAEAVRPKLDRRVFFADLEGKLVDEQSDAAPVLPAPDPSRVVAIPFTSGTMGKPKGVVTTGGNVHASMINGISAFGSVPGLRNLVNKSLGFHPMVVAQVLMPVWVGGTIVMHRQYDVAAAVRELTTGNVGLISHVPTTLRRFLTELGDRDVARSAVHFVGAAPLSEALLHESIDRLGVVLQGWGMTEATNIVTCTSRVDFGQGTGRIDWAAALTVGRALPNSVVRIQLADDQLVDPEVGLQGEAVISGPMVCPGYWNDQDPTTSALRGGLLRTGDLLEVPSPGLFRVVGRSKNLIISGGINVSPDEIANTIEQVSGVIEAAVVGMPDEEWGEVITAAVVVAPGSDITADRLREHCHARLARYKCPRRFVFMAELPRNPNGKLAKAELLKMLDVADGRSRADPA